MQNYEINRLKLEQVSNLHVLYIAPNGVHVGSPKHDGRQYGVPLQPPDQLRRRSSGSSEPDRPEQLSIPESGEQPHRVCHHGLHHVSVCGTVRLGAQERQGRRDQGQW